MDNSTEKMAISRRNLIIGTASVAGLALVPEQLLAGISRKSKRSLYHSSRFLAFENLHTGEMAKFTYWENGRYIKSTLSEINHILRDHRTDEVARIDVNLLNHLFALHAKLDSKKPFQIISGYRSPKTNAKLRRTSSGVAKKSLHMQGRAIDVNIEGVSLSRLRKAAIDMKFGGVGYYPESSFIHIDTGDIRQWG
ncbi:MAG: DUF882 domain-containing protein [Rickettsiales bacterium]